MATKGNADISLEIELLSDNAKAQLKKFSSSINAEMGKIEAQVKKGSVSTGFIDIKDIKGNVKSATQAYLDGFKKVSAVSPTKGGFTTDSFMDVDRLGLLQSTMKKVTQTTGQALPQVKKDITVSSKQISSEINALNSVFKKMDKETGAATANMASVSKKNMDKLKKSVEMKQPPFQGWALSIMFAGMAIKNAMNQIWTSSTKTFQEVMHSVEGTTTGFDMLQGSMAYLGFTVGQALEPIAMWLVPIIDSVSEWVSQNEGLVRFGFILGTIVGTLATIGGGMVLAKAGVDGLASALGLATTNAKGLVSYDWSKIGTRITQGIGLVAIYWAFEEAKDAMKSFEDKKWVTGMLQSISSALMGVGGIVALAGGAAFGGALIVLGIAFKLVAEDKLMQSVVSLTSVIGASFEATWDWAMSGVQKLILQVQYAYQLARAAALATKLDLGGAATALSEAKKLKAELDALKDKSWGDYWTDSYKDALEGAKLIDAQIKEMKSAAESVTQITFNGNNLGTQGVKELVSEAFGSLSAPSLFRNDQFQKDITNSIGNIEINVQQNKGESELDFANRIVIEIARQLGLTYNQYNGAR